MAARKVRDEADARMLLDAAERSGEPRARWCQSAGVDARSLNAWRLNLARRSGSRSNKAPVGLVELVLSEPSSRPSPNVVRIHHGAFVVEVDATVNPEALVGVLWAVCRC